VNLHSELGTSIFDEDMLRRNIYDGDIIADCWFPDKILPVIPNNELLTTLIGPDGQLLYDLLTKQWNVRFLLLILRKVAGSEGWLRLPPEQEEGVLSTLMTAVMDALIHHHNSKHPSTSVLQRTEASTVNAER